MRRTRRGFFLFSASAIAATAACIVACSTTAKAVGEGGECFQATDCDVGLVCIPMPNNGKRVCSKDLSGIVHSEDAGGPSDATTDGARDGATDAPPSDGAPPVDSGQPDTGTPVDSGGGNDAATD